MIPKVLLVAAVCFIFIVMIQVNAQSYSLWFHFLMSDIDSEAKGEVLDIRRDFAGGGGPGVVRYHFSYIYYVKGKPYTGYVFSHEGLARYEDVNGKYFEGAPVTIYYDSAKPSYSVVEIRNPGFRIYISLLPLFVFCFYVIVLLSKRKKNKK